jgi:NADPH:quinone reductase-like Zn-dependent oxidoreductase
MPTNEAAWLPAKTSALEVGPAPYTHPGEREILVRNRAVAINPVDWIKATLGDMMFSWIKRPFVLGSDIAGEVVEVGSGVTRFKVGDRVVGNALGSDPNRNRSAEGAFQLYSVLLGHMASTIPDSMSYERACVLPLCISTAACGLFQKDHLALQHPSIPPRPTGETVVVWGGSTSVGSNAIQLAVAAGYEVITTCSPRNFDYVRKLGATWAFDYHSKTAVADIVAALKGKTCAGALAIGGGSASPCFDIVHASKGRKFVSTASPPVTLDGVFDRPGGVGLKMLGVMPRMMATGASLALKSRIQGIATKFIFGSTLFANEVGPAIWVDFLPRALAEGSYVAAPEPRVVGTGLAAIQKAFDIQKDGVSASKIVVALP